MTNQEAGGHKGPPLVEAPLAGIGMPGRAGQSDAPQGQERSYTLVMLVSDSPGAIDRVVSLLRRRRAGIQNLVIGRSELPGVVRIVAIVNDSKVEFAHLLEQLRKVVDVRHVVNLLSEQVIARELALVKVNSTAVNCSEIMELAHLCGAHVVDVTSETITLEVTGSEEKIEKFVSQLQSYGIREIARTGYVAMTRGAGNNEVETMETIEDKE